MGINALGNSSGVEVKVFNETPGPQRMSAWNSGDMGGRAGMMNLNYHKFPITFDSINKLNT